MTMPEEAEMNRFLILLYAGIIFALPLASSAEAQIGAAGPRNPATRDGRDVGFDQRLGAEIPGNVMVKDEWGMLQPFSGFLGPRPLILVMAYYRCPSLCSLVLNGIFSALAQLPYKAGRDYSLAVISIDPTEGFELARAKKESFLRRYPKLGESAAIHFLAADQAAIKEVAGAIGFRYSYDPKTQEYSHPGGLVVLNSEKRISHYLFGLDFRERDLRLALVEASAAVVGKAIDRFLLLCYRYDENAGGYSLAIFRVIQFLGGGTALALCFFIASSLRRERKSPKGGWI